MTPEQCREAFEEQFSAWKTPALWTMEPAGIAYAWTWQIRRADGSYTFTSRLLPEFRKAIPITRSLTSGR